MCYFSLRYTVDIVIAVAMAAATVAPQCLLKIYMLCELSVKSDKFSNLPLVFN